MQASDYITTLDMVPHPEGGFFKETYRSGNILAESALPAGFTGERVFSTAIYFLLQAGDFSAFHRIKSDECWHFYAGGPLWIYVLHPNGDLVTTTLGNQVQSKQYLQYVVPADHWFASAPADGTDFSLVGCTVSPGFDFNDFEMAKSSVLCNEFPTHAQLIKSLTRQ